MDDKQRKKDIDLMIRGIEADIKTLNDKKMALQTEKKSLSVKKVKPTTTTTTNSNSNTSTTPIKK